GLDLVVMETSTWEHASPPFLRWPKRNSQASAAAAQPIPAPARLRLIAGSGKKSGAETVLARLRGAARGRVRLAAAMHHRGDDRAPLAQRAPLARHAGVPPLA